jgi:MoaA/NifB/PqqE/SkfB family radical SAM enzyme
MSFQTKVLTSVAKSYYLKKDSPCIANWIITAQCNCKCPFCELGIENLYKPDEELSTERCFEVIKEMKEIGIKVVTLSGGEVFLKKDFFKILAELKRNGMKIGIVSNGLLLNSLSEEKIEMLKRNLDSLVISIDSSIAEEHNEYRRTPMLFQLIMKGIDKLQGYGYTNITFESIIMGQNYKRIPELVALTKKKRVKRIMFRPINIISNFPQLTPVSNKDEFADYDVNEIIKYIDIAIKKAKELEVNTDLHVNRKWVVEYFKNLNKKDGYFHDRVMSNYFCFIPFTYLIVNYNGDLLPCLLLRGKGNILQNSIKEERRKSNSIREQLAKREFFPECNCCFDQANNNVRFSAICSPIRNIGVMKELVKDFSSVNKRFTRGVK